MSLDAYRIFTDGDGFVFMAARNDGGRIKVLAECLEISTAYEAILSDAGLRVPILDRDMDLGGRSYEPRPEDWE